MSEPNGNGHNHVRVYTLLRHIKRTIQPRKKKREGFAVPYGTDLLLEPYGFATILFFYNANHKNQLPYGSGLLLLPYGNVSVSSSCSLTTFLQIK